MLLSCDFVIIYMNTCTKFLNKYNIFGKQDKRDQKPLPNMKATRVYL